MSAAASGSTSAKDARAAQDQDAAGNSILTTRPPPPSGPLSQDYQRPTVWTAIQSFSPAEEIRRFRQGKVSCMRSSLLLGLGTGVAVLGVGVVARRPIRSSANWGVAAFLGVSVASHVSCQRSRQAEAARIKVIVEEYKRKPRQAVADAGLEMKA